MPSSLVIDPLSFPKKPVEIVKSDDGHYFLVCEDKKLPISNPHDIDLLFAANVLQVNSGSIYQAQLRYSMLHPDDYKIENEAKNDFFEDGKFQPELLAKRIMDIERFITDYYSKEIFVWRNGYYQPIGEQVIEEHARTLLGSELRRNRLNETVAYIRASTYTMIREPPPHLINLENGIYDLITGELKPHDPSLHFFNKIPVKYDPNAECPAIQKFLEEITGSKEDAEILIEMVGYCLYRGYPIQKALMLVGDGANGKTTFLSLLTRFLGHENVSNRSLHELETNRFAKASLFGKLANIYDDLPDKALRQTGTFKMLTGGAPIEAEKKFRNSFTFINYAKLIFSANKVPEATDDTDAFFRRWIIITFPNKFEGENCDPHLIEKLTKPEELSGLLNLALQALRRLLEQGRFSHSKTTDEIREDYIRKSDPLAAFVMDCLEQDMESWILKKDLYNIFTAYCRMHKLPAVSNRTFFQNLPKHIAVTEFRPRIKDRQPRALKGIRLSDYAKKHFVPDVPEIQSFSYFSEKSDPKFNKNREKHGFPAQMAQSQSSSEIKIEYTCGDCIHFRRSSCAMENPFLIQPTAAYPEICNKFQKSL